MDMMMPFGGRGCGTSTQFFLPKDLGRLMLKEMI